jgi:DAACS family dicarboxylate/amino acid:cation (Na+ or H+) symporter
MLIGFAAGASLGAVAHAAFAGHPALETLVRYVTQPAGQIFLRLLFMLVVPLIVSALALGVTGLGDLRRLGRVGAITLIYTVVVSAIAVVLGVRGAACRRRRATPCSKGRPSARQGWPRPPRRRAVSIC